MDPICALRRAARLTILLAAIGALAFILPSIISAPPVSAQTGVPGLFTCSDGSQSLSGCSGVGIGFCGGSMVSAGQACSGPGVGGCGPGQCFPSPINTCPGGLSLSCSTTSNQQNCPNAPANSRVAVGSSCIYITCPNGNQVPANVGCPAPTPTQLCPGGQVIPTAQICPPLNPVPVSQPVAAAPPGISVTYQAGWNIIAGPSGITVSATGPLYTLQAGDTSYETLPPGVALKPGAGYLAYFAASTTVTLPVVPSASVTVQLPPGQFVLIGNGGDTNASVSGADTVLTFNPSSNSFAPALSLAPGQGAWAISNNGGQATITNSPS
jgi:hypothetical protein